jgi:hypothetical protein
VLRVVAVLAGVVLVAAGSVAAVDAWRAATAHPRPCEFAEPRGELFSHGDTLTRAWAALTDPGAETIGDIGGSRFVLSRSCVLFAGRFSGTGEPHVVIVEPTIDGYHELLRVAEVRLPESGAALRAGAAHSRLLASELDRGVVLPLSGRFLVGDEDAGAARVATGHDGFRGFADATVEADGVVELGAVPDRALAPSAQGDDVAAVVVVTTAQGPRAALVPVVPVPEGGPPSRPTVTLAVDGAATIDEATLHVVAPVLPLLTADPRFLAALDRVVQPTSLLVTTAAAAGGVRVEVTVSYGFTRPAVPAFAYLVRDGAAEPLPSP